MADFEVTITLRTQTCGNNHVYAVPCSAVWHSMCPLCAWDKAQVKNEQEGRMARQISALKGALTRARKAPRG